MFKKGDIVPGTKISCTIDGKYCKEAKIQIEDEMVFICQNECFGDECLDKLGYDASWSVGHTGYIENDTDLFFARTGVCDVKLLADKQWDEKENLYIGA